MEWGGREAAPLRYASVSAGRGYRRAVELDVRVANQDPDTSHLEPLRVRSKGRVLGCRLCGSSNCRMQALGRRVLVVLGESLVRPGSSAARLREQLHVFLS